MAVQTISVQEFEDFINLPENADRLFEFVGSEITEVLTTPFRSSLAARIIGFLFIYLLNHDIGHVTGEAGGYWVSGERYAPDVAFISKARQPELARSGYNPLPPDLAIEIVSPTDSERKLMVKVGNYLAAGTVVWVVYPDDQQVAVYLPGQPVSIASIDAALDGGVVLPGFTLPVRDIFPVS